MLNLNKTFKKLYLSICCLYEREIDREKTERQGLRERDGEDCEEIPNARFGDYNFSMLKGNQIQTAIM